VKQLFLSIVIVAFSATALGQGAQDRILSSGAAEVDPSGANIAAPLNGMVGGGAVGVGGAGLLWLSLKAGEAENRAVSLTRLRWGTGVVGGLMILGGGAYAIHSGSQFSFGNNEGRLERQMQRMESASQIGTARGGHGGIYRP